METTEALISARLMSELVLIRPHDQKLSDTILVADRVDRRQGYGQVVNSAAGVLVEVGAWVIFDRIMGTHYDDDSLNTLVLIKGKHVLAILGPTKVFTVLGGRVLILLDNYERERTPSGLEIADYGIEHELVEGGIKDTAVDTRKPVLTGEVLSANSRDFRPGSHVVVRDGRGTEVKRSNLTYLILDENDILAEVT